MWQMVGILAELERSLIQEHTKAGRTLYRVLGIEGAVLRHTVRVGVRSQ